MKEFKKLDGTERFRIVGSPQAFHMHHKPINAVKIETPVAEYVCADCGREGSEPNGPCKDCRSYRISSIEFVKKTFGENWRDAFKETDQ